MSRAELFIEELLAPILPKLNITDHSLEVNSGSAKGDGYLGDIWNVKVHHSNGDIKLVVKTAEPDEHQREIIRIELLFESEINFYTTIFPAMDALQVEKQVEYPLKLTKCYGSSLTKGKEALILQDLKSEGYSLYDRKKPFDEAHLTLALKHYAKLHALSFALRSQRPEVFRQLTDSVINIMPLIYPNFIDSVRAQILKNAEMLKQRELIKEANAVEKVAKEVEKIYYMNEEPPDQYSVILHGDCWINNMLFKYDVRL